MHVQHSTLLINTLPPSLQHCLIKTTVDIRFEERVVNAFIHKTPDIMIIVYGKNSNDITILHKYEQLVKLGFTNVHIYTGGIFEWMLLHEIYGKDLFKITNYEIDILRYRPKSVLLTAMAGGGIGSGKGRDEESNLYIEDGAETQKDFRINIPENTSGENAESGSLLSNGFRWMFGI